MNDAAYCAYGCPQGKRCPVADPQLGCVVGTALANNPGRPRCCEVDANDHFIDVVRAILTYGSLGQNVLHYPGTAGIRDALQTLLDNMKLGGPSVQNGFSDVLTIHPGQLVPTTIDELVQLLHKMVPISGFSVDMELSHIERQPRAWRANPVNYFYSTRAPLQNLPPNTLTLAAKLEIWPENVSGSQVVALVLNVLANPDPWPTARVELRLEQGCHPLIRRRHITDLRRAMHTTRFVGRITIDGIHRPFAAHVQPGRFVVAPGKQMLITTDVLEITVV